MEHQSLRNPLRRDQINNFELPSYGSMSSGHGQTKPVIPVNPVMRPNASVDEFGDLELEKSNVNKIMRTGRQRKKIASRSKGGEFQQRRKKRRVYFCCVSNEIDIEQLHDNFDKMDGRKWMSRMYEGVLHLSFSSPQSHDISLRDINIEKLAETDPIEAEDYFQGSPDGYETSLGTYNNSLGFTDYLPIISEEENPEKNEKSERNEKNERNITICRDGSIDRLLNIRNTPARNDRNNPEERSLPLSLISRQLSDQPDENEYQTASMLVLTGGKEVFVFDFGAVVFWGFKHGEEEEMLERIRYHVVKDW